MRQLTLGIKRALAVCVILSLTTATAAPGIAAACEGGGEENEVAMFSIIPEKSTLKGLKSTTHVTVENVGSGSGTPKRLEGHLSLEFTLPVPKELTGCSRTYAAGESCSFTVEYAGKTDDSAKFEVEDESGVTESTTIFGEGEGGGFVGFAFVPSELKWAAKETKAKKLEIKVVPGSDAVKLLTQSTNDPTDFEVKDPNKCFGKTFTAPCSIEVNRKTTTKTGLKFWEFTYEDESRHLKFTNPFAVDLKGE